MRAIIFYFRNMSDLEFNECEKEDTNDCDSNKSVCDDRPIGYACECKEGFYGNPAQQCVGMSC